MESRAPLDSERDGCPAESWVDPKDHPLLVSFTGLGTFSVATSSLATPGSCAGGVPCLGAVGGGGAGREGPEGDFNFWIQSIEIFEPIPPSSFFFVFLLEVKSKSALSCSSVPEKIGLLDMVFSRVGERVASEGCLRKFIRFGKV